MTDRQRKLDAITDSVYYYMVEVASLASSVEDIGFNKEGEELRSIADQLERIGIQLLKRKRRKKVTHHEI